jgi:hypothetical protein
MRLALQGVGAAEHNLAIVGVAPRQLAAQFDVKIFEELARRHDTVLAGRDTA